jgi:hypothetical protein
MRHFPCARLSGLVARLLAGLLFATVIIIVPLGAHAASVTHPGHGFGPAYDATHEITLEGTIQQVVTKHTLGSPVGMHLMVSGPNGLVDAHVGAFLSKETKAALVAGMPVKIVGAKAMLHGKSYLLARELTVGENTVTIRSAHGLIIPRHTDRPRAPRTRKPSQTESKEGAR